MITRKVTTADLIGIDDQSTQNQVTITDTGVGIGSASTGAKLFVDQDANAISLEIDSESTSVDVLRIVFRRLEASWVLMKLCRRSDGSLRTRNLTTKSRPRDSRITMTASPIISICAFLIMNID